MEKMDYINWWERTKEPGLNQLKDKFVKMFPEVKFLPSIYHPVLYKFLKNPQIKHFNNEIFDFSIKKIKEIESKLGEEVMESTLLSNFHLLVSAYYSMIDLEERVMLMNRFNGNEELKAKIFSINIYNDLLNTSFSDILKFFIEFQSVIENNDKLFQKNLTPQIECLAKPERGYQKITDLANSNIRNAISHGGVKAIGSKMIFTYKIGREYFTQESTTYDFKDSMLQLYDGVSAILLAWFAYLCENNITYDEVYENDKVHTETAYFFEKLSMSTLLIACDKIFKQEINNETERKNQINIEFSNVDLEIDERILFGLFTAERVFLLEKLSLHDSIMVSFNSPKTVKSFFIIDCSVVNDLVNGVIDYEKAAKIIIDKKSILIGPINDEDRNQYEDSFRYYPDIENEDFYVTEIEDISTDTQKRFKAVAYLKRAKRKKHVQEAVNSIIGKLKEYENYGFSSHKVKHGKINADIIYLVLYKNEVRRGKDRALYPNNNNFIAQVQYDVDMKFPIHNNIIDKHLKKRTEKAIEYNWNPNF